MKKSIYTLQVLLLISCISQISCNDKEETIEPITMLPFTGDIGDYYQGGTVFYIDSTGIHGLIASVQDLTAKVPWGCYGTVLSAPDGAPAEPIGLGLQNTEDILRFCLDNVGTAAEISYNLDYNGYGDWFLPSKQELTQMYNNRVLINATAIANNGKAFENGGYWSSTGADPSMYAYVYLFHVDDVGTDRKDALNYVRPVRAF
ncbi:MAG: hypothetical protein COA58_13500 [Bacteroidetes bacterium]|nr:MAG: hypothetical protein COA58_13500 [Bacteroidota bacterium]